MAALTVPDTIVQFRLKRAEQFAQQWRQNAKRLAALAAQAGTPALVRTDAITEATSASAIVSQRMAELAELTKQRGYSQWQADPVVAPILVEIHALHKALDNVLTALKKT